MKTNTKFLIPWRSSLKKTMLLLTMFLGGILYAQVDGSTCDAPIVVGEMPFSDTGNTSTYGNNYSSSDVPSEAPGAIIDGTGNTTYLSGDEVVYSYLAGANGSITINTTNNDIDGWVGLWVFTECPFESTVGYHTSIDGGTRSIPDLPVLAGETYYIIISTWNLDDPTDYTISIEGTDVGDPPTCLKPKYLTVYSTSADEAEISWIAGEDETQWEVIFGEAGFDIETEGESFSVNDDPILQFTDLTSNTNYAAYVKAICADDDMSALAGPLNFTTACIATDIPFTQDFEDVTTPDIPNCASIEVNSGNPWKTSNITTHGFNGQVLMYSYANSEADSWYFTQGINLEAGVDYQISYQYGNNSTTYTEKLKVAYGSSANSSAMNEELIDQDISLNGSEISEINFSVDSDGIYYFGFQVHSVSNQYYVYLDNILIDIAPTCFKPTDLAVDNITADNADVSWTAGDDETNWEILYGEAGFDVDSEGTSEDVTTTNITLEELESDTSYDVYVRAVCSEDDQSYWVGPVSFTTNCEAADVPFMQNFNDVTVPNLPNCGGVETISGADWKTGSSPYGMDFDGNVLVHSYDYANDLNAWYFTQGINLETGVDYEISYKYSNNSTTYTEKLKVAFGTSSSADAMTEDLADHNAISTTEVLSNDETFSVDADGVYYFGFQVYSIINQNQLYVDDISIVELSECVDASAGTPEETELTVCAGIPFTIAVNDASTEDPGMGGLIGQWEASTDGGDSWTAIDDATAPSYVVEDGIEEPTDFRYEVTCTNTDETDISDVITVDLNPATECYCDDATSTSVEPITRVVFAGIDNSSPAAVNSDGYEDFTDIVAEVEAGETYTFTGEGNTNGDYEAYFTVWIDWNQNGVFETEEMYEIDGFIEDSDGTDGQQVTDDILVPGDAVSGETRMRVRKKYNSYQTDPCGSYTFGQTEDYTVNVGSGTPVGCPNPSNIIIADITADTALVSWTAGGDETQWEVVYGEAGFDQDVEGESTLADATSITITDLVLDTEYDVYVRSICDEDDYSLWTGPESFTAGEETTEDCEAPTDIEVTDVTETTADVSWESTDDVTEWEVVYGDTGFDPEAGGETILADATSTTITDLDSDTEYDVYVRSVCGEDDYSDWVGPINFTTEAEEEPGGSYCEGEGVDFGEYGGVENFSTSDGITNIDNQDIEDPTGYHNFTDMVVSQAAGESFTFTADIDEGGYGDAGVAIYIDYNNDFEFGLELPERAFTTSLDGFVTTITATITIPADTDPGNYRLRITSDNMTSSPTPCNPLGSMHDYTLTVMGGDVEDCEAPTDIEVTNVTDTTADVYWDSSDDVTEWEVVYGDAGFDPNAEGDSILADETSTTITDLDSDTEYDVYVRSVCGDVNSDWVGPETFTTEEEPIEVCEAPTDFEVTNITDTTADVSWTPSGEEMKWAVIYGESGFTLEEEEDYQTNIVLIPNHTLENLIPETDYDVYVFAICDEENMIYSDLVGPITFLTDDMSVDSQEFTNFTYYPNPVENQLSLKAGVQIENVQVFNLLGQNVLNVQPNSLEAQINTDALQSGVYLMEVSINGSQKTFRVVKK